MLTLEILHSNAKAFQNALAIGAGLRYFDEVAEEQRVWRLIIRRPKQLLDAISFIQTCQSLNNKRVYRDGRKVEWNEVFGFLDCYGEKLRHNHDWKYCHGIYDGLNNLWGCQSLGGWEFGKHGRKHGRWNGKKWIFDKKAIELEALSQSRHCELCPAYDRKRLAAIVNALPTSVDPVKDPSWCFSQSPVAPTDPIHLIEIKRPRCTEVMYSSGVSMSAQSIESILDVNTRLTSRKIPWQVAEWQVVRGNLDHEVITPMQYRKRRQALRRG